MYTYIRAYIRRAHGYVHTDINFMAGSYKSDPFLAEISFLVEAEWKMTSAQHGRLAPSGSSSYAVTSTRMSCQYFAAS
jgi:hypothetical protein